MKLVKVDGTEKDVRRLCAQYNLATSSGRREPGNGIREKELAEAVGFVLKRLPPADAVEVVRCGDCKFCMRSQVLRQHRCYCPQKSSHVVEDNGYCSFGVRK